MNSKVEISSLSISKLRNEDNSFVKYDIEAALDEIENTETDAKLKYKFVLLSNPTNIKINIEGFATIYTNQSELPQYLGLDEKKIPHIVNIVYQEMFPLFYVLTKSMQIPCPAYKLSEVSAIGKETTAIEQPSEKSTEQVQESTNLNESQTGPEIQEIEQLPEQEPPLQEPLLQEQPLQEPVIKS